MSLQLQEDILYKKWIAFTTKRSVLECDFFKIRSDFAADLLGEFCIERLAAFGEHASGSLFCFYSQLQQTTDNSPVAWIDSEGVPCIVISKNLREFLSILPYGAGFIYTIAASIENNFGASDLSNLVLDKVTTVPLQLLDDAKKRFTEVDSFIEWLASESIEVNSNPAQTIVNAHLSQPDLTTWIVDNLI